MTPKETNNDIAKVLFWLFAFTLTISLLVAIYKPPAAQCNCNKNDDFDFVKRRYEIEIEALKRLNHDQDILIRLLEIKDAK